MKNISCIKTFFLATLILAVLFNCKKEDPKVVPTVGFSKVSNITTEGAASESEVISDGGMEVTSRGVCWSVQENPTIFDSRSTDGTGIGNFMSTITGLFPAKTYYIRAFAKNTVGVGYSSQSTFRTMATLPVLSTLPITAATNTSAMCGGDISSNGGDEVTARGICWSTQQNPSLLDNKTNNGTGSGRFASSITGINPGAIYYIRAYATNSAGTAYGNQVTAIAISGSPLIGDGSYVTIQKATTGKGIDLVFMGDGYTVQDILNNKYDDNIRQAVASFFNIEPYKTYSQYFNIYMVYAYSDESGISNSTTTVKTKFETKFLGGSSGTEMTANLTTCRTYALMAPILDVNNGVSILIANSLLYGGTTYLHYNQTAWNVSICPMPPNYFSYVVQHEAAGHGFGNLADEYVNVNGWIPQDQVTILHSFQSSGIFMNVDITSNLTQVLWNHFIGLPNYNYVKAYEGGFLYSQGVWRSENNSLMVNNIKYFNATCREIIVKKIMQLAGLTYSFADFQAKDVMELTPGTKSAGLIIDKSKMLPPPVVFK